MLSEGTFEQVEERRAWSIRDDEGKLDRGCGDGVRFRGSHSPISAVARGRIELPTPGFSDRCSSY